jgi:hypothetical protein
LGGMDPVDQDEGSAGPGRIILYFITSFLFRKL